MLNLAMRLVIGVGVTWKAVILLRLWSERTVVLYLKRKEMRETHAVH